MWARAVKDGKGDEVEYLLEPYSRGGSTSSCPIPCAAADQSADDELSVADDELSVADDQTAQDDSEDEDDESASVDAGCRTPRSRCLPSQSRFS